MRVLEIGAVADLIEAIALDCDLVPVVLAALTVADMDLHGVRRRRAAYIVKHLIGLVRPRLLHVLATLVQALARDTPITVDDDGLLEQVTRHVMTLGEHQDLVLHDLYNRLIERVPTGKRQMIVDAALGALRSSGRSLAELSRSCSTWLRSQTLTLHANAVDLLAAASDLSTSRRHEDQVAGLVEQALSQLEGVEARQLRQTAADILIRLHGALGNDPELSAAFRLRAEQYPGNDPRRSQEMLRARQTFVECNEYERAASICDRLMFGYTGPDADPGSCRAVRAELVDRMHSEDRLYPLYCRALFSRSTRWHDPSVSDREFVYRLDIGETVLEFTNRIRIVYPYAKVVNTSSSTWTGSATSTMTMAGAVDTAGDNATILVCRCHVVAQFAMPESAPVRARERLTMTDSSQFSYTYCPGPGAVSNVTTTRTVISVRDRFPCLFRRQPVVARRTETVTALQAALEQVQEKTASIGRCCDYVEGDTKDTPGRINALSMQLNGTIDAAVNGGLEVYRASFMSDKYKADHPEDASQVDALRNACTAQVAVLHRGLTVMERVMCADLEPLYKHLRRALNTIHQQWTQQ
ncbi:hypothetical protein PBRA_001775 [Plasmodiophora brassicae]|nr:hypothetical protein PBRA_001775 [Plasmodiophora brassicae]